MELGSIAGILIGIISGIVLFIKGIKSCKCTMRGISIERDHTDELGRQQEFTLKIIEMMNNAERGEEFKKQLDCISEENSEFSDLTEISDLTRKNTKEKTKDQIIKILQILNNQEPEIKSKSRAGKMFESLINTVKKKRDNVARDKIRNELTKEISKMQINESKNKKRKKNRKSRQSRQRRHSTHTETIQRQYSNNINRNRRHTLGANDVDDVNRARDLHERGSLRENLHEQPFRNDLRQDRVLEQPRADMRFQFDRDLSIPNMKEKIEESKMAPHRREMSLKDKKKEDKKNSKDPQERTTFHSDGEEKVVTNFFVKK